MVMRFFIEKMNKGKFISYEICEHPYSGPRRKAIKALRQRTIKPVLAIDFMYYLKHKYRQHLKSIEWIRFHRFVEDKISYAVAILNIAPSLESRTQLYEDRELITRETGWYPLIMGSKARIHLPLIDRASIWDNMEHLKLTSFGNVSSMRESSQRSGNSFKIIFQHANLLLDVGFDCSSLFDESTKCIFLSHFHQDHSGGLERVLTSERHVPILLSIQTFNTLWRIFESLKKKDLQEKLLRRALIVAPNENIKIRDGCSLSFIETYHCPGSIGISITDPINKSIIYLGDLCLRNGFLDYRPTVKKLLCDANEKSEHTICFLDSTFINKKYDNIPYTQTPKEILELIKSGREIPNIWFISRQPETLIYLFLFFFRETRQKYDYPKKLLADNKVLTLLLSILPAYYKRCQRPV